MTFNIIISSLTVGGHCRLFMMHLMISRSSNIVLRFAWMEFLLCFDLNNNMICHDSPSWFLSRFCLLGGYLIEVISYPFFIVLGHLLPFFHYIGSSLTLFSLYWVIFYPFYIILGHLLPLFHYIGSSLTLFSLYWVISYPFYIILGHLLPFCILLGHLLPFLYYIEVFTASFCRTLRR